MILRLALFLNAILICVLGLKAQDTTVSMPVTEYEHIKAKLDSLNNTVAGQKDLIKSLNNQLSLQNDSIAQIHLLLSEKSADSQNHEAALKSLRDSLVQKNRQVESLMKQLSSLDMVRLRYANGRLQMPYDNKKINEAIELFDGIQDTSLKDQYQEVRYWLTQYDMFIRDVNTMLSSLQSDSRRTDKFKFEDWKRYAINEINDNLYVRSSASHQFKILYLDGIISSAKKRIQTAGSKPSVDFSDLLEQMVIK